MNRERIMELEQKKSGVKVHMSKIVFGILVYIYTKNTSILKYISLKKAA